MVVCGVIRFSYSPYLVDHDGEVIGTHQWEEEVLKETGGEYLYVKVSKNKINPHSTLEICTITHKLVKSLRISVNFS